MLISVMFSDSEVGCREIGLQEGLLETVLLCILQSPQYVLYTVYCLDIMLISVMFSDSEVGCREIGLQEGLLETVLLCIL